jgi:hypothetical protein
VPFQILPSTEERILRPALDRLDPQLRAAVEADLDELLADPRSPQRIGWTWWKGEPESPSLSRSRVSILAGRVAFRYVVLADYPYVVAVNLVDLTEVLDAGAGP